MAIQPSHVPEFVDSIVLIPLRRRDFSTPTAAYYAPRPPNLPELSQLP
jgi:hypothetical protein